MQKTTDKKRKKNGRKKHFICREKNVYLAFFLGVQEFVLGVTGVLCSKANKFERQTLVYLLHYRTNMLRVSSVTPVTPKTDSCNS